MTDGTIHRDCMETHVKGSLATGDGAGTPSVEETTKFRRRDTPLSGSSGFSMRAALNGPDLPPIYLTVRKEREKHLVTRHLNGGRYTRSESTPHGASVSQVEVIGCFANPGDQRHNHTMHRFDFRNTRHLSTSFITSNLMCTTCQEEHRVLRREIDGGDMGNDTPPVFILTDQNFPLMVPAGGGMGMVHV
jgi:hypothetical protein